MVSFWNVTRSTISAALRVAIATASCASADIIPTSEDRTVQSSGSILQQGFTVATDGSTVSVHDLFCIPASNCYGDFDKSKNIAIEQSQSEFGAHVDAVASQLSSVTPTSVSVHLFADASADSHGTNDDGYPPLASASMASGFWLLFNTTTPGMYRFSVTGNVVDWGDAHVALNGGTMKPFESFGETIPETVFFLDAGGYMLDSAAHAFPSADFGSYVTGRGEITFTLEQVADPVPEPATAFLMFGVGGLISVRQLARRPQRSS